MEVLQFIETLAPLAIKHGKPKGINPALIIAQGVLESAAGTSELAVKANNLFGIKKGGGWTGDTFKKVTGEYRKNAEGEDEYYEIVAEFRKYDSYEGAVIDLVDKYTNGLSWEDHNRYAGVINAPSIVEAVRASHAAGYATDPTYPEKIVRIYEQYALSRFEDESHGKPNEGEDRMFKIAIDAGHGKYTPGKRTPDGEREWTFNDKVVRAFMAELKNYEGVKVYRVDDPSGETDVPLKTRVARANGWGADLYISCHHNALTGVYGTHTGVETFYSNRLSSTSQAARLAANVHPRVVDAMKLADRGIRTAPFYVLRWTAMPAILVEGGFMDSKIDIKKMRSDAYLKAQGIAIMEGTARFAGLKRKASKPTPKPEPVVRHLYRVRKTWADEKSQLGAFEELELAKKLADQFDDYEVYDHKGKVVYKPAVDKVEKPAVDNAGNTNKGEVDELIDTVIVLNTESDFSPAVVKLHKRTGWPFMLREEVDKQIAKKLVIVGGGISGLDEYADEVELLSGNRWEATVAAVDEYIQKGGYKR